MGSWCEVMIVCFFFQAEDGIRDRLVTGVQTCALPICTMCPRRPSGGGVGPGLHKGFTKLGSDLVVFMSIGTIKCRLFLLNSFSHL